MKYKYLLFDLDGTLFDYDKAESDALKNTFIHFGFNYEADYLHQYRQVNKLIWQDFENGKISQKKLKTKRFDQLSHVLKLKFDPLEFSNRYLINLSNGTELIPGAKELLEKLVGKSKLYLITNGLTIVQKPRIRHSPISNYFDDVIISEEVGLAKPQKEIFDLAFEKMDFPDKKEVLMVGDSLTSDITGGFNYGIDTCWVNQKNMENNEDIKPTYEIDNLFEILKIVD